MRKSMRQGRVFDIVNPADVLGLSLHQVRNLIVDLLVEEPNLIGVFRSEVPRPIGVVLLVHAVDVSIDGDGLSCVVLPGNRLSFGPMACICVRASRNGQVLGRGGYHLRVFDDLVANGLRREVRAVVELRRIFGGTEDQGIDLVDLVDLGGEVDVVFLQDGGWPVGADQAAVYEQRDLAVVRAFPHEADVMPDAALEEQLVGHSGGRYGHADLGQVRLIDRAEVCVSQDSIGEPQHEILLQRLDAGLIDFQREAVLVLLKVRHHVDEVVVPLDAGWPVGLEPELDLAGLDIPGGDGEVLGRVGFLVRVVIVGPVGQSPALLGQVLLTDEEPLDIHVTGIDCWIDVGGAGGLLPVLDFGFQVQEISQRTFVKVLGGSVLARIDDDPGGTQAEGPRRVDLRLAAVLESEWMIDGDAIVERIDPDDIGAFVSLRIVRMDNLHSLANPEVLNREEADLESSRIRRLSRQHSLDLVIDVVQVSDG